MKKTTIANAVFLLIFLGAMVAFPLWTVLGPRSTFSSYENRALAAKPQISAEGLLDGSLFGDIDTFLSDRLAWRDGLLTMSTWLDYSLTGKEVVNDQVIAGDVLVPYQGFSKWDLGYVKEQSADMGDRLLTLNNQITNYGGYFLYVGIPEQFSYFRDRYPAHMDSRDWVLEPIQAEFTAALAQRQVPFLDVGLVYDALGRPDDFYSKIDHHYTYAGMLAAYEATMERINADTGLNISYVKEDGLTLTSLPNPYLGSRSRRLCGLWRSNEAVVIGELKNPIPFTRVDNGEVIPSTLYALPTTETEPIGFTTYMGGDISETIIRTDRPELPNALIFGDSFTDPFETVFWTGFNETRSLDLRGYTAKSLEEYIAEYQPDVVICIRDDTSYTNLEGNGKLQK